MTVGSFPGQGTGVGPGRPAGPAAVAQGLAASRGPFCDHPGPGAPPLNWSPLKQVLAQRAERGHHKQSWTCLSDPEVHTGQWAPPLPGQTTLCGQESGHLDPGVHVLDNSSTYSELMQTPSGHPRKHPLKKIMKKTQSFEIPLGCGPRNGHWPGHTGFFVRGLETTTATAPEKVDP